MVMLPKGFYSVCSSSSGDKPVFTLRVCGINSFQVNYCYDQVPCSVNAFQGDPIPEYGNLAILPFNSTCFSSSKTTSERFPNEGVSFAPVSKGRIYSFGPDPINLPTVPAQYRVCWMPPNASHVVPAGTLIIQPFEVYYRQFIETSPDWEPYDSPVKIYILSTILFLAVGVAVVSPFVMALIKRFRTAQRRKTDSNLHPIIARLCDEEVGEDTTGRLQTIDSVPHPGERMQTRMRRSEIAFKLFSVSELS